jgi:hypothetical protein
LGFSTTTGRNMQRSGPSNSPATKFSNSAAGGWFQKAERELAPLQTIVLHNTMSGPPI